MYIASLIQYCNISLKGADERYHCDIVRTHKHTLHRLLICIQWCPWRNICRGILSDFLNTLSSHYYYALRKTVVVESQYSKVLKKYVFFMLLNIENVWPKYEHRVKDVTVSSGTASDHKVSCCHLLCQQSNCTFARRIIIIRWTNAAILHQYKQMESPSYVPLKPVTVKHTILGHHRS